MSNRWGIPKWLEEKVKERDKYCVYCGIPLIEKPIQGGSRQDQATWEHIINDASIITPENIARCCAACNSSKGTKDLIDWLNSSYCKEKEITAKSVADVVKSAIKQSKKINLLKNE
jgi:hypothetical protein